MKVSAAKLKILAIITMFIDHLTVVVVEKLMLRGLIFEEFVSSHFSAVVKGYYIGRLIGRIAYPIFLFFIVEGFLHTSSKPKYALRLFVFALISEIPFDLAFNRAVFEFGYQNVYFNLLLGLLAIWLMDEIQKTKLNKFIQVLLCITGVSIIAYVSEWILHTDYGYMGVLAMSLTYFAKKVSNVFAMIVGVGILSIFNQFELAAFIDVPIIATYDGTRGKQNKYFFYLFYPVHLLLLSSLYLFF